MGSFPIIALVFSLALTVLAESGHNGHDGGSRSDHILNILFPACNTLDAAMASKFSVDDSLCQLLDHHRSTMNAFIIILLVFSMSGLTLVESRGPKGGASPHQLMNVFPECKSFGDAMMSKFKEQMRSGKISPQLCRDEDCFKSALQIVRCSVSDKPSEECISKVSSFLQGSDCGEESST
ncbi:hypothetical protein NPIL_690021 [Nephila pilipes]|uniref:Uncharacterized protein n=1 Tax=Nephila pilipes TaxID=299642 RepID=A0A8X6P535_NEPPI|nr:hypothetical protein NPIL_690021 [Nephila pilipes]